MAVPSPVGDVKYSVPNLSSFVLNTWKLNSVQFNKVHFKLNCNSCSIQAIFKRSSAKKLRASSPRKVDGFLMGTIQFKMRR